MKTGPISMIASIQSMESIVIDIQNQPFFQKGVIHEKSPVSVRRIFYKFYRLFRMDNDHTWDYRIFADCVGGII